MPLTDKQRSLASSKILTRRIKTLVIAFINMEADKDLQFSNTGNIEDAKRLISSMRVKLSRMRTEIRNKRLTLNNFKMHLKSISYEPESNKSIITLTKTAPMAEEQAFINELFNKDNI